MKWKRFKIEKIFFFFRAIGDIRVISSNSKSTKLQSILNFESFHNPD